MKLRLRLKLAWKAFWLIPFKETLKPYHRNGYVVPDFYCDNRHLHNGEHHEQLIVLVKTMIELEIGPEDYYHLCPECADKAEGKIEKDSGYSDGRFGTVYKLR